MAIPPEIAAVIDASPFRDTSMLWRHDNVGTVARELIERDKQLSDITPEEVTRLMRLLRDQCAEYGTQGMKVSYGDKGDQVDISIGGREVRVGYNRWLSSADIPGLYPYGEMPLQPEAHQQAADQINALLEKMGHPPQVRGAARIRGYNHTIDFETTELTIETPERPGHYEMFGYYAHRPAEMRLAQSHKMAMLIDMRITNKEMVLAARQAMEKSVEAYLAKVEGMKVVGSTYQIDSHGSHKNGCLQGNAYATIEMLGDTLQVITAMGTDRESGSNLKKLISKHRANFKRLGDREPGEALMCEPILAAAIRDMAPKHGKGLLKEIEAALAGRALNPTNPRRRGISNISIHRGILSAPVTLMPGKEGARFMKGRINLKGIKQLPQIVIDALPGKPLREVVDHPYMDGLTIKSLTVNSYGLQLRPEDAPVPLAEVLADLRKAISST